MNVFEEKMMSASFVRFGPMLRAGSGLAALAVAGLMSSPAVAQDQSATQPVIQPTATTPPIAGPAPTAPTPTAPDAGPPHSAKSQSGRATKADQKDPQAIVITGTVSRQTQTASPVTVVSAANLQDRGITTVSDAIQLLAANNAGTAPTSWTSFGFATGASAPSLRGFNDAYTVTLFDGLRSAVYPLADDGFRNFVDINTIPELIVDRVEVLQDGASANYGADAIAGVVNVIVKRHIEGLHLNGSYGISQRGDAGEKRFDATVGYGSLADQGFNVYVNAEYQNNDALYMRDRGYPFNTADQSKICGQSIYTSGTTCGFNNILNGIQASGTYRGFQTTTVGFGRPYDPSTVAAAVAAGTNPTALGPYQLLNPAAGCEGLTSYTLTPAQRTASAPAVVCQQDLVNQYQQYDPRVERKGLNFHTTVNLTPDIQAYAMANWYETKTQSQISPLSFTGQTAAGGKTVALAGIFLPVYVCPGATPTISPSGFVTFSGCNASNGALNPNNPFASQGKYALLSERFDQPRETSTDANTYRASAGVSGTFSGFNFNVDATTSRVDLEITQKNSIFLKNLLSAVGTGLYNFVNQSLNTDAQREFIAPTNVNDSTSKLTQIEATIGRDVFTLPGGNVNLAVGGSYRQELLFNPSANPANAVDPTARYYNINAVGAVGSRNVWSGYYSLDVPAFTDFDFKAEGRYDKYSSGQKAFSPKFELQYRPIEEIKLRGTYSRGFRIPSFNEAFGLPTTGYVSGTINCNSAAFASFCAAHANNPSYLSPYMYGLTSIGNPSLAPEKSSSLTVGTVVEPTRMLTLTVDYWHTKINNIIIAAVPSQALIDQYYQNNGKVTAPPGVTLLPGVPDPSNPTALPLLGFVQASYTNADSEVGSGIDFSATARVPLTSSGVRLVSSLNASYLAELTLTDPNAGKQVYAGTLSPCNITSCSGAPRWRGSWENTIDFNGRGSLSVTTYYTSGYSEISTDFGGTLGDCNGSTATMSQTFVDGSPILCRSKAVWDVDLTAQAKVMKNLTVYGNVLDLLDIKPPYDPNAAYGLYQFNPAWADRNFIGRFFRIGARVDF